MVKKSQKHFKSQQAYLGTINGQVEEVYSGHLVVQAFNKQEAAIQEFNQTNQKLYESAWKSQFLSGMMMPIMTFVGNLGYVAVAFSGALLAIRGVITIGDIQAFIQYVRNFTQPIQQIAQVMNMLQSMAAAAERVFEFLGEEEESLQPEHPLPVKDVQGAVTFEHVQFGYNADRVIIHDFSAEVQPGQKIVEQELAKEFKTSRAPIREALRELENEGLVEYVRNAGCSVKEITFEESFEIYLMRANYEIMAVRLLGGKIPEETLQEMEEILERMKSLNVDEYDQLFSYDNKFHSCLIRMTGMKSLYKAWKSLNYGNIVTGYNLASDKKAVIKRQYPIHKELLEACKSRKKEEICRVLSDHYMGTIHRLLKEQGMTEADTRFSLDFLIS